jgi:hypothetical protein
MNDLHQLCKSLSQRATSAPDTFVGQYVENDPAVRSAIAAFTGLKTDVCSDLSSESLSRLRVSLVMSDFTSLFLRGGTGMQVIMAAGRADYWPTEVVLPVELLREHNVAIENGYPQISPCHMMRLDDETKAFLREIESLQTDGRLMVRPSPGIAAITNQRNAEGGRDIQMLDVDPNLPNSAWVYRAESDA